MLAEDAIRAAIFNHQKQTKLQKEKQKQARE